VQGLSVGCILSLCGNQFNQRIILYIILTTSLWGNVSNGNVLTIAHTLSLTVWMNLSISGTCLSLPIMFRLMPCSSISDPIHSNCWSPNICLILKPCPRYMLMICCIDLIIVNFVLFWIISAVPKCIAHDVVIINGIPLIYKISTAMVMLPCSERNSFGRLSSELRTTHSGVLCTDFPFKLPSFGPRMSSAHRMSSFVIGQLGIMPSCIYFI